MIREPRIPFERFDPLRPATRLGRIKRWCRWHEGTIVVAFFLALIIGGGIWASK